MPFPAPPTFAPGVPIVVQAVRRRRPLASSPIGGIMAYAGASGGGLILGGFVLPSAVFSGTTATGGAIVGGNAQPSSPTFGWTHIESTGGTSIGSQGSLTVTLSNPVAVGDLIRVGVTTNNPVSTVTDNYGNTYIQLQTNAASGAHLYAYYSIASFGGSALAVKFTPTVASFITMSVDHDSSGGGTITLAGSGTATGTTTAISPGAITFTGDGLDWGLATLPTTAMSIFPDSGYTAEYGIPYSAGTNFGIQSEALLNDTSGSATPGFTIATGHIWLAIGAVFTTTSSAPSFTGQSTGGAVAGGLASPSAIFTGLVSGGAIAGGNAQGSSLTIFSGQSAGGAALGGLISPLVIFVGTSSGGIVGGGSIRPTIDFVAMASGGMVAGGVAIVSATGTYSGQSGGGPVLGGVAIVSSSGMPQQTFRQALCAKLESIAELSSIFAAIYPGTLPMTHDFFRDGAALSYTITSMPRGHVLSGSDGTATATVQLSAWSYNESVSDAIALELFNAIDGVFNDTSWGNGTIVVMSCLHDDEEDLPEPPKDRSDDWIYQIASVYIIKHRIVLPTNT